MAPPLLFHEKLRSLLDERKMTYEDLAYLGRRRSGYRLTKNTIVSYLRAERLGTLPEAWIIEAIAAGLDVDPSVFYEWPLAEFRATIRPSDPPIDDEPLKPAVTQRAREAAQRLDDTPSTSRRKRRAQGDGGQGT